MPFVDHKAITGADALHPSMYVQSSDPGAVGAFIQWIDTTGTLPVWKYRNSGNSGWVTVADFNALALLASPVFTGNPTAPTPSPGDNDTSLATTAFVTAAIAAGPTRCRVSLSGTLSVPNNTPTLIGFDTDDEDPSNLHDPVSNNSRITVAASGLYLVHLAVAVTFSAGGFFKIYASKNGSTTGMPANDYGPFANDLQSWAFMVQLAASDYLELGLSQVTGAGATLAAGAVAQLVKLT